MSHLAKPPGLIKRHWQSYTSFGQFFLALALVAIIVDAVICFNYGFTQTFWHGAGFALLAIVFAVLPDAAAQEWDKGGKASAITLGIVCIPLGIVAYQSHLGYSAGVRVGDIQRTTVQNVKYDDARGNVEEARKTLTLFEGRLAALEKQNGWAASATADSLRARLPALELAISQEAARGGCKQRCLDRTRERDELVERIKTLEAKADYTEKIEAAKRVIAAAREKAAGTKHVESAVVNQTNVAAQLWLTFQGREAADAINPDSVTQTFVNTGIAGANSLAFMLMAPVCWFVAGRNRRRKSDDEPEIAQPTPHVARETVNTPATIPGNTIIVNKQEDFWAALHNVLTKAKAA